MRTKKTKLTLLFRLKENAGGNFRCNNPLRYIDINILQIHNNLRGSVQSRFPITIHPRFANLPQSTDPRFLRKHLTWW